jgi:hypothetical protein
MLFTIKQLLEGSRKVMRLELEGIQSQNDMVAKLNSDKLDLKSLDESQIREFIEELAGRDWSK